MVKDLIVSKHNSEKNNYFILATAGHIDHGKTTLVKAITGIDTDRLKEEKERGMSIELGYSFLKLDNNTTVGIIDVPGHEKFIHKMIAGVYEINAVMLLIACDDGVMPQTIEHLEIINYLQIKDGFIVLTKTDLVDKIKIDQLKNELKMLVKNTIFENKPILEFSAKNNSGKDDIIAAIKNLVNNKEDKVINNEEYMISIDRVFNLKGIGTVVTGTSLKGKVKIDDELTIVETGKKCIVKNIQIHNENSCFAEKGMRTALNLKGIELNDLKKGYILAKENSYKLNKILNVFLQITNKQVNIANNQKIRFLIYSKEILGKIKLLDRNFAYTCDSIYCQIILDEPIPADISDKFVIQNYTPIYIIGGGEILSFGKKIYKKDDGAFLSYLQALHKKSVNNDLIYKIFKYENIYFEKKELLERLTKINYPFEKIKNIFYLDEEKEIVSLESLHNEIIKEINNLLEIIFFKDNRFSINKTNFIKYLEKHDIILNEKYLAKIFDFLPKYTFDGNVIKIKKDLIIEKIKIDILNLFDSSFNPIEIDSIINQIKGYSKENLKNAIKSLVANKDIVYLAKDLVVKKETYKLALEKLYDYFKKNEKITLAEFKNLLQVSRKIALYYLEKFDLEKITVRINDYRVLKN